jgi:membrane protein
VKDLHLRQRYATTKDRILTVYHQVNEATFGIAGIIYRSVDNFIKFGGPREAAALSYYALFSLFPLLLLLIAVIGWLLGPATAGNQIEDFLRLFLPGQTAIEINRTISRFVEEGSSASLVASIAFAWSALGLFSNLEAALSRTFRDTSQRPWWQRRMNGFLMVIALGILLVANIVTSLLFSFLDLLFLNQSNLWLSVIGIFVPFGFSMGIFAMLYRWVPRKHVGWDAIWPAALLGGVAWELAKRVFGYYLETIANLSIVYGSITTVIIFMLWAFYTTGILLFFAEFCVSLADYLEERKRPEQHEFAGDYYDRLLALPEPTDREAL